MSANEMPSTLASVSVSANEVPSSLASVSVSAKEVPSTLASLSDSPNEVQCTIASVSVPADTQTMTFNTYTASVTQLGSLVFLFFTNVSAF